MENKTFEYKFTKIFKVASDGNFIDAEFIVITEPPNSLINDVNIIQQQFLKSLSESSSKRNIESKETSNTKESESIINDFGAKEIFIGLSQSGANLQLCIEKLKSILIKTAKINDSIQFTSDMFSKLSIKDVNTILGGYLKTFLLEDLLG